LREVRDVYELQTVEQLRTIADELRQRILAALTETAMTITQGGERLGVAAAKAHYHVRELERVGLVRLVETREKGGILEKYYRSVALDFSVPGSLLRSMPPDEAFDTVSTFMRETSRGLLQAFRTAAEEPQSSNRVALSRLILWLTDEEFRELVSSIDDVLSPYQHRRGIPGERERTFVHLIYDTEAGMIRETDDRAAPASGESQPKIALEILLSGKRKVHRTIVAGGVSYSREELERRRERGEILDVTVLGYLSFADDVPAELVDQVIGRVRHKGILRASSQIRSVLDRKKEAG
jgi:DNA-binding transcriptional ArsR family regulator